MILLIFWGGFIDQLLPQERWKWNKIDCNFEETVHIISASSSNDFWVITNSGDLIHYLNGRTSNYETIIPHDYSRLSFTALSNKSFIVTAMDNQWRSHIYYFSEGKWKKDPMIFRLPLQSIHKISDSLVYAIGNFGTMLKYENSKWTEIKTPLKSHINFLEMTSSSQIFLLTNSEGVYSFDGTTFTKVPFEVENKWDLTSIKAFGHDTIFVMDSKRKLYSYNNGKFVKDNSTGRKLIFGDSENTAFFEYALKTDHVNYLHVKIPSIYRFINYKSFHADSILCSERGGDIYKAGIAKSNYFTNLSRPFNIKSNEHTFNHLGAVFDFNNDSLPDIITGNRSTKQSLTFFINNYPMPFSSDNCSNFSQYDLLGSAAFLDFNNDYFIDFVIVQRDTGGVKLALYENDGNEAFVKKRTIPLPGENISRNPQNLKPVDFDGDGLIDLCVSFYYGPLSKPGYEIIINNTFLNDFGKTDTTFIELTRGWNTQSLFADFNGDNMNDWIIANKWKANKLLIQNKVSYKDESEEQFLPSNSTETAGVCAADFNNDGNLDLLTLSDQYFLTLFQNDGKGFFTDVTSMVGLDKIILGDSIVSYASIALADYNNDGFVDIFLADKSLKNEKNYLLINIEGKYFVDKTEEMQIQTPVLHHAIASDIENDGDIDIFTFGSNEYALWINNLNDDNYIKIKPRGVISNTDGWGTKVWIYEAGYLNNNSYLKGYQQIGAEIFGNSQSGEYLAHFGVEAGKNYDVKIKFYGGKEIVLYNLRAGQTYYVDELSGIYAFVYRFPGLTIRILRNQEVQFYIVITFLTFVILFLGVRWGLKKYQWDVKLSLGFVSVSISIYWLLLLLTRSSESVFQKYYLPMLIAIAGILIPHLVFLWITRNQSKGHSKESISDDLFFELIQFSHGAWALSNLNSLQLLLENIEGNLNNNKYIETLNERLTTFNEMILPKLNSIVNLSEGIDINRDLLLSLKTSIKKVNSFNLYEYKNESSEPAKAIITIKESLTAVKKTIYISYSCNPVDVIKTTCDTLKNLFDENKITLSRCNHLDVMKGVLIKNYELADIIDNCLQNSVKALASTGSKEISIKVYSLAPKIYIDIADNGSGIEENEKEKIFESGYSKRKSTGHGLYSAREVLKKYGGRIFVKSSSKKEGTVFTIELNEGILK